MDQIDKIMAFESGELDFDATVELFQDLIDSKVRMVVWQIL
jgi:hypothetical protein